ncbi:MAG TPA: hypothetical protein VMM56_00625 [Planctomycetaceae bacterium]|nr:hypothetical protein [Planctomycetaceae bacterium]
MNNLDSRTRKLLYFGGIILLSIPIIYLGRPSAGMEQGSGGKLAQLRSEYDLGESTLGQVDPSSATMNLVLLGMRGVASSVLWNQANEEQENKNWASLRATTQSIIKLQPHFRKVWEFQGWNLAYNVSKEWDDVRDRYYWVKEGAKFLKDGVRQNENIPDLYWYTGFILGNKIGNSDEWKYFRKYFISDPDVKKWNGGPDSDLNPNRLDNYLVGQIWFYDANKVEALPGIEQHRMQQMLFRAYPSHAQFGYAQALYKEGQFNEQSREAWELAYELWTREFGREEHESPGGFIILESTPEDIKRLSERDGVSEETKRRWTNSYQDRCQYRFWRSLAALESEDLAREARRNIYDGKQFYRDQKFRESQRLLELGMEQFERLLLDYDSLKGEDQIIEDALMTILYWKSIHDVRDEEIPAEYPLKQFFDQHQSRMESVEPFFRREIEN